MQSDVEIAQAHQLEAIDAIAAKLDIPRKAILPYGNSKAKIAIDNAPERKGKLVLVTGISPTPAGEGKSTVLIGLADAMTKTGHKAVVAIREPSLGPVMGIKGGAAGGGYSQIVPMEDINLHFTGDFHAITSANNTLAAIIDNHIHQGNDLGIDVRRITWQRCQDVNDRSLRHVVTGLGGKAHGVPTETGFSITAASEIMAILCLATDLDDLQQRIARVVVAQNFQGEPVTVADLNAEGALTALMRDAINPNLVQTLGGTPALVHGGPFANIAHGCNSLIATDIALRYSDVVLTEAGFGSDLGAEKFFDIKARAGGLNVDAAVIVATIRSLKYNGGASREVLNQEDLDSLRAGVVNLKRHVANIRLFGVEPVVALNEFTFDAESEREFLEQWASEEGITLVPVAAWERGGDGAIALAETLTQHWDHQSHSLYDPQDGIEASIRTIATRVYHAQDVEFSKKARNDLAYLKANGWDTLPVCISKTQYSFSDDPTALGAAEGHVLHVRELLPRIGAGFVVALTGDVMTMPGLPKRPAAEGIAVEGGKITGLF